ncbi:MAG: hypothetical protein D6757_05025 [Alphaproteobacteria bacterium]|nr:MAG: hypothetical protein D6757_05025 [Alphaproteobacteria bacterium]
MRLAPIVDRIRANAPALKHVGGGANLAALSSAPSRTPAAFVVPVRESASANTSATMDVAQRITRRFGIIIVVRNASDARGEAALDGGLAAARAEVDAAIVGWAPEADAGLVTRASGRLLSFAAGALWWQDEYEYETWRSA